MEDRFRLSGPLSFDVGQFTLVDCQGTGPMGTDSSVFGLSGALLLLGLLQAISGEQGGRMGWRSGRSKSCLRYTMVHADLACSVRIRPLAVDLDIITQLVQHEKVAAVRCSRFLRRQKDGQFNDRKSQPRP